MHGKLVIPSFVWFCIEKFANFQALETYQRKLTNPHLKLTRLQILNNNYLIMTVLQTNTDKLWYVLQYQPPLNQNMENVGQLVEHQFRRKGNIKPWLSFCCQTWDRFLLVVVVYVRSGTRPSKATIKSFSSDSFLFSKEASFLQHSTE